MQLSTALAIAACDGTRDCALSELEDARCGTTIEVSAQLARVVVRAFTPSPTLFFTTTLGSCGNGTRSRLFALNETDPSSADAPHARVVHESAWGLDARNRCVALDPPTIAGLPMSLEVHGVDDTLVFGRENLTLSPRFASGAARASWVGASDGYADVRFEMDEDAYAFPRCCVLPDNFTDTEGRVWVRSAYEATCGIADSAEYAYLGRRPTTTAEHNRTHDTWTFEVASPAESACGTGILFEPFEVSVRAPLSEYGLADAPTLTPRYLVAPSNAVRDPLALVLVLVLGSFALAACWAWRADIARLARNVAPNQSTKPTKQKKKKSGKS